MCEEEDHVVLADERFVVTMEVDHEVRLVLIGLMLATILDHRGSRQEIFVTQGSSVTLARNYITRAFFSLYLCGCFSGQNSRSFGSAELYIS